MKTIKRFINYDYIDTVEDVSLFKELGEFQHAEGNPDKRTYTVLSEEDGWAFSQTYWTMPDNKCGWSRAWKHERGIRTKFDTCFDDLLDRARHAESEIESIKVEERITRSGHQI